MLTTQVSAYKSLDVKWLSVNEVWDNNGQAEYQTMSYTGVMFYLLLRVCKTQCDEHTCQRG